ncbi:MAG: IS4 family transposase [Chloroflexota bacterium]
MNLEKNQTKTEDLAHDIEAFLQKVIEAVENEDEQPRKRVGRKQILPSLVLWSGVIVAVLRGFESQLDVWRLVSWDGFWHHSPKKVCDQAVYNRLENEGSQYLHKLFLKVREGLSERLGPYVQKQIAPFATGVYALDGSTLDKVARHLPKLKQVPNGDSRLLPGKLVGLFDIRLQQWREMIHLPNPNQNDKTVARELVQGLPKGSLILADLGFFGFQWFDQLTDWKMWWVSRLREKTTFDVIHTYYQDGDLFDGIIWLGKYRADKAAHAVRLVTFTVGKTQFRYITNVLDPQRLSLHDIAVLYARRWDIELAFKMVKRHLNLHILWSAKQEIILQQVWSVLIIAQILHAFQMEIAGLAQVDPFDVSLELITRYVPRLTSEGKNPVQMIVDQGRDFGFIRPSRRIRPQTPPVDPLKIIPLPPDTTLVRKPRYAQRRCDPPAPSSQNVTSQGVFWYPWLC